MQRRSFLKNAACVGACAGLFSLSPPTLAAGRPSAFALNLLKVIKADQSCINAAYAVPHFGPVQVRASEHWKDASMSNVLLRAWFVSDSGSKAFDFASVGKYGASSNLRFSTLAERIASFDARTLNATDLRPGAVSAQCLTTSHGGGFLSPGNYWLVLHRADAKVEFPEHHAVAARVRLDVVALVA